MSRGCIRTPSRPRANPSSGKSTSAAMVVRLCASINGGTSGTTSPIRRSFPVKTARPRLAEIPQKSADAAM